MFCKITHMNETVKNIFIGELDAVLSRVEGLPDGNPVLEQIYGVTDPGNLRAVFANMKFFLETGTIPKSAAGSSSLPAVVFGLPAFRDFFAAECGGKISPADVLEASVSYLAAYKNRVV
jgi:hypothetical protein